MKTDDPLIVLGSDHAGFSLKEAVKKQLFNKGLVIEDVSPVRVAGDDYPDSARKLSVLVKKKRRSFGLLFCRTGTGMVMAANKIKGIRAAFAHDNFTAKMARKDENANVLCFPSSTAPAAAVKQVLTFIKTEFSGATRHKRRIRKLSKLCD